MVMKEKFLVSACLTGDICRYDAKKKKNAALLDKLHKMNGEYVAVCPEVLGGLPTPRAEAQIQKGDGYDVLHGKNIVVNKKGCDVTNNFIAGAKKTLEIALKNKVKKAILKERSPSCGVNHIYNDDNLVKGMGITTALLTKHGIEAVSDEDFLKNVAK